MAFLETLFSGGVGAVLSGVGNLAKDIRVAITGKDPIKEAEVNAKLLELEFLAEKAQTDINLAEASNPNLFVSGWRPFIGWICGVGLFYHFIGFSVFQWAIALWKLDVTAPVLDTGGLMSLVLAMLGMGGLRTFEKVKGVVNK